MNFSTVWTMFICSESCILWYIYSHFLLCIYTAVTAFGANYISFLKLYIIVTFDSGWSFMLGKAAKWYFCKARILFLNLLIFLKVPLCPVDTTVLFHVELFEVGITLKQKGKQNQILCSWFSPACHMLDLQMKYLLDHAIVLFYN